MKRKKQNFFVIFCLTVFLGSFMFLSGGVSAQTFVAATSFAENTENTQIEQTPQKGFISKKFEASNSVLKKEIFQAPWNFIKTELSKTVQFLKSRKENLKQGISEEREELKADLQESIKGAFSKLWQRIKGSIKGGIERIF